MLLVGPALGFQTSWVSVAPLQIESKYNLIFLETINQNLPLKKLFKFCSFTLSVLNISNQKQAIFNIFDDILLHIYSTMKHE